MGGEENVVDKNGVCEWGCLIVEWIVFVGVVIRMGVLLKG